MNISTFMRSLGPNSGSSHLRSQADLGLRGGLILLSLTIYPILARAGSEIVRWVIAQLTIPSSLKRSTILACFEPSKPLRSDW